MCTDEKQGPGKTALQSRMLAALVKYQSSVPRTQVRWLTATETAVLGRSDALFWPPGSTTVTCTYPTHMHN